LVVDDDPSILRGIERLLRAHGFRSELFGSVEDFHRRANMHDAICLVLDINLDGRSGIEVRHQLAGSGMTIPVIFITADDSDTVRRAALEAGCVAYIAKPFAARSLIDAIDKATAKAGGIR
jgi:FixJ family two-component response regulator